MYTATSRGKQDNKYVVGFVCTSEVDKSLFNVNINYVLKHDQKEDKYDKYVNEEGITFLINRFYTSDENPLFPVFTTFNVKKN